MIYNKRFNSCFQICNENLSIVAERNITHIKIQAISMYFKDDVLVTSVKDSLHNISIKLKLTDSRIVGDSGVIRKDQLKISVCKFKVFSVV